MSPKKRGSPIAAQTIASAQPSQSSATVPTLRPVGRLPLSSGAGVVTLGGIARALEARGIRTSGGPTWRRVQVARLVQVIQRNTVSIVVACDSVFLPLDVEGNVPADAANVNKVKRGTRLQAPIDLARSLESRGQVSIGT